MKMHPIPDVIRNLAAETSRETVQLMDPLTFERWKGLVEGTRISHNRAESLTKAMSECADSVYDALGGSVTLLWLMGVVRNDRQFIEEARADAATLGISNADFDGLLRELRRKPSAA